MYFTVRLSTLGNEIHLLRELFKYIRIALLNINTLLIILSWNYLKIYFSAYYAKYIKCDLTCSQRFKEIILITGCPVLFPAMSSDTLFIIYSLKSF